MRFDVDKLDPAKAAVVVVDVQNDYCHPDGACARRGEDVSAAKEMLPRLQALLAGARAHGVPVVFVRTAHEKATDSAALTVRSGGRSGVVCRAGTWGAEFFEVAPLPDEPVVAKHRYSGFVNTRLDSVLRTLKAETLVMAGVSTNVCVESTARHGYMLDYHIAFMGDCCAAFTEAEHEAALVNIDKYFGSVMKADELLGVWDTAQFG
ncbi:isochorismatase family cysteine hydrolase [Amycolatopsis rhabdoformis]|uniref:Isochorismatase family cysteine hydrolase n=1 Tax=Amycolatopsis rhabdoformis TaxID=1448059 RepID=A0ABZ1I350_9PSEU|nr:isochorismatase family cysteine hydrolase [Amycolatopsis rhabdoformis]WSE28829.1 isochorismatase family cysteine hydrolase [Amycolatopsis rhabdoformis]